ncbi:hypothetical protein GS887_28100 [Rhodococcus hoagii]|nr:hypothetical protein [Prescottella equi]
MTRAATGAVRGVTGALTLRLVCSPPPRSARVRGETTVDSDQPRQVEDSERGVPAATVEQFPSGCHRPRLRVSRFHEGYSATAGESAVRAELCDEALRLGRLLCELVPAEPEVWGLSALMCLQDSRRDTRVDATGRAVPLDEQNRVDGTASGSRKAWRA